MRFDVDAGYLTYARSAFAKIQGLVCAPIHVKLDNLNPCGSIKLVPAIQLIEDLERSGKLGPDSTVIESSSGNLGIALSAVCANKGYRFVCVTDPNTSPHSLGLMKAFGAEVKMVRDRDTAGGFLVTCINLIKTLCAADPSLVWVNQYANKSNWMAHYNYTAREIADRFEKIDWLFIGVGTTGTLMGCARYFRKHRPQTKIVAVDSTGSVTFGGAAGPRHIPGLGTSRRPEIADERLVDHVHQVDEAAAVSMCRSIARGGLLVGGSTGSVLCGIHDYGARIEPGDVVVTISPDLGDKYLTTIYNDEWTQARFGLQVREPNEVESAL
ncbi:Ornithine cyclodeaminase [Candidatus Burkholderia humilis]|nr:Ornithine cyclodeaminase [Candidatus Burkholderia humilis]